MYLTRKTFHLKIDPFFYNLSGSNSLNRNSLVSACIHVDSSPKFALVLYKEVEMFIISNVILRVMLVESSIGDLSIVRVIIRNY